MNADHQLDAHRDPHRGQPVVAAGASLEDAAAAMVLVHGRGASAENILTLTSALEPAGAPYAGSYAYRAPQAEGATWYPLSFLAPQADNQPKLDSALAQLHRVVEEVEAGGVPARRIVLLGFSQGACLSTEYAARHPRRLGGVVAFTGGLIGPPNTPRDYSGSLDGTPVFLGSGDPDPHVPWWRVEETAEVLQGLGAEVTLQRYPGIPHTIVDDEIHHARRLMAGVVDQLSA
ncbi:MAG: dienelactone hydrolase family protein [Acidobacteriota bacterium]|nr:dienelactone hydrolase family protein [Acidobacteriota bacterium]